jgi:hypothetical protein
MLRRGMMRKAAGGKSDMTQWTDGVTYTDIEVVQNSYYNANGGITSYNGWDRTGKIPIHGASRIDFAPFNAAGIDKTFCHFFGENGRSVGSFSSRISATGSSEPVPAGAWYFGISSYRGQIAAVLESGITPYA